MTWTEDDRRWAEAQGLSLPQLDRQLERLRGPRETLPIDRPARPGDGIEVLDVEQQRRLAAAPVPADRVSSFIPASGAASRMFAALVRAHARGLTDRDGLVAACDAEPSLRAALDAFDGRDRLAVGRGLEGASLGEVLRRWLDEQQLPTLPKGLVPMHRYPDGDRVAAEEHLHEAAAVVGGPTRVHFTVPEGHAAAFVAQGTRAARHEVQVETSVQQRRTDTVATTPDGAIFRDDQGRPLLRPGGHGALLPNLEAMGGDLVLVKNIDNVTGDSDRERVVRWRRILLARLVELEAQAQAHLAALDGGADPDPALAWSRDTFGRTGHGANRVQMARDALRRPIRVVGVVRNDGQPGGGPFWVRDADGQPTLQIVESAQIDAKDAEQLALFQSATHFNPVDMALSMRDPTGRPWPLQPLVDARGWIYASKTWRGRKLNALERPGLWNGAMAGWNTVFVEVPAWTFRPVKELRDLVDRQC